ncbi:MAG: pyridoxine 5'-phosphate synthase [Bacteriovoracaceae bacterium]|jgi:pyridoxine 5-phosphate synthase|nr:pyridoxine 5'-phosphate synthase [Bacteriovoracaceae bacterium]
MNLPKLGINIDHVATLRQQRDEHYPCVVKAANICLESGADQITIHLREDRRHIQDFDVKAVCEVTKQFNKPLNLEIGCIPEIVNIAINIAPEWVCLVPENREEKTTEGGLNLTRDPIFQKVKETCEKLKTETPNSKISLFLESNNQILAKAAELPIDAVEIHTGDFARAHINNENTEELLKSFENSLIFLKSKDIACHAGHGLTINSVKPLVEKNLFQEYNIGHWVIAVSVYEGLKNVVRDLKNTLNGNNL